MLEKLTSEGFGHKHESYESLEEELKSLGFKDVTGMYYWHPLASRDEFVKRFGREPKLEDVESGNLDMQQFFKKIDNNQHVNGYGKNNSKDVFYTSNGKVWLRDLLDADITDGYFDNIKDLKESIIHIDYKEEEKTGKRSPLFEDGAFVPLSNGEEVLHSHREF